MTTVAPPSGATRDTHQESPDCPGVHRHYLVTMAEMLRATVAALLEQEPGTALCDACLSFACSTTLIEARQITESLVAQGPEFQRASTCASCRRTVPATFRRKPAKCVHCSEAMGDHDTGLLVDGQAFHVHCLRRLITDEKVHVSRTLNRRSRDLIAQSRRRIGEANALA